MDYFGGNQLSFTITARDNASPALKTLKNNVASLKSGLQKIGSGVTSSFSKIGGAFSSSTKNVKTLSKDLNSSSGFLKTLVSSATKAIGVFSGFSIIRDTFRNMGQITSDAFERLDTMDLFQQKMTMITGSAENATKALEQLKTSTKGTPYALDIAARAVQNFVTRGMDTQKATDSVDIWMDAVSAYGKGTNEQFNSVIDAIAKMRTKGTVEMRYLNRLFAAGINPVQMYAKATGQAAEDVQNALTKKTLRTEEFLDVVETAMREGTNGVLKIEGAAKRLASTWSATFTNMRIAMVRGVTEVISALDDAFKVFDQDNGLKGLFKSFGSGTEEVLQTIADGIRLIMPPIFKASKEAFEYWKTNYFDPIKEYFQKHLQPFLEARTVIQEAFNVDGDVDMVSLLDQIGYQYNGSIKDAFLEIGMTWESIRKVARDTWRALKNNDAKNSKQSPIEFNVDVALYKFLTLIDNLLGSIKNRTADFVTAFYKLGKSVGAAFASVGEILGSVAIGIGTIVSGLAAIIIPPAIDFLTQLFTDFSDILDFLNPIVKGFIEQKLPEYLEAIVDELDKFKSWSGFTYISKMFSTIAEKVRGTFETVATYIGYLRGLNPIQRGNPNNPEDETEKIIQIVDNIREIPPRVKKALAPLKDIFTDVFSFKFDSSGINAGYSSLLDVIVSFSNFLKEKLPEATETLAVFASNVIKNIKPVADWLWAFATEYVAPFALSVIRAFGSIAPKIIEVVGAFLLFGATLASFVIPPVLTVLTNIFNWIADHSSAVIGGLIGIVAAILTFKAITTTITVVSTLANVIGMLSETVSSFIAVVVEQGFAAAIGAILNPATLIPVAIAAFIGLAAALIYFYNTNDTVKEGILNFVSTMIYYATGIKFSTDQVEEGFNQMGEVIKGFIDILEDFFSAIDEFFDYLPMLRQFFGIFLKGPMGSNLSWTFGNDEEWTKHDPIPRTESHSLTRDLNPADKLSPNKIEIPNLVDNLEQWNTIIEQTRTKAKQMVTQDIPEVGATTQQQVHELQVATQTAVDSSSPVDVSSLLKNLYNIPNNGSEIGRDFSVNLSVNAQEYLNNLQQLDPSLYTQLVSQLPNEGTQVGAELSQNLDVTAKSTLSNLESLDPSTYTELLKLLPTEGLSIGSDLTANMDFGAETTLSGLGSLDPSTWTSLLDALPAEGYDIGSGLGNNLAGGVTGSEGEVNSATSAISNSTLKTLRAILSSTPTYLAGSDFIKIFNAGFTAEAASTYQMVAVFAKNVLTQLAAGFIGADEKIPQTIATAMTNVVNIVEMKIKDVCKLISDNLMTAKQNADTTTAQLAEAIRNNFATAETSATASIQQMKTNVIAKYEELRTSVTDKLGAIETVQSTFSSTHMNTFQKDINSALDSVETGYNDMNTNIRKVIDTLPQYVYDTMIHMMDQMKQGLRDKKREVESVTGEIVQALKNKFEEGLGIHSPSRWGEWIGQMILAGFINGLSGSQLTKFVENIINDMQNSFNSNPAGFNADATVNFLSDDAVPKLIAKITGMDFSSVSSESIAYPLVGTLGTQTSWFGPRSSPGGIGSRNHAGVDLATPTGTPIVSALAGNVSIAGWYGGYGNAVKVNTGELEIVYGHMSKILASVGQNVTKGQQIGLVGSTGNSTGPHLHFEIRQNGSPIDPQPYIQGASIGVGSSLASVIQQAYDRKHGIVNIAGLGMLGSTSGSGIIEPDWFKSWTPSPEVARWLPQVNQALQILGEPASLAKGVLWAIEGESSGNPNTINLWDYNARIGDPTKGLLQIMMANFRPVTQGGWGVPGYTNNIWDPLENILTGLGEMKWKPVYARNGGIAGVINKRLSEGHWRGYAVGTRYVPEDMLAPIHKGEAILPASQNPYTNSGGDYLSDLFNVILENGNNELQGLSLRDNTQGSTTQNDNSSINNNNFYFNTTINKDADGDRFLNNLDTEIHRILENGRSLGTPR